MLQFRGRVFYINEMGFLGKFTKWVSNGVQGITNKVSNVWNKVKDTASDAWEKTKGVAGKVWEGVKDAGAKVGKFLYDNSDAIGAALGAGAAGLASYYGVDPGTIMSVREAVGGAANYLPDGKLKDFILSAAWKPKSKPPPTTPKVELVDESPKGAGYATNVSAHGPPMKQNENQTSVSGNYVQRIPTPKVPAINYDPMFVQNTSSAVSPLHPVYTGKYTHKSSGRGRVKQKRVPKKVKK